MKRSLLALLLVLLTIVGLKYRQVNDFHPMDDRLSYQTAAREMIILSQISSWNEQHPMDVIPLDPRYVMEKTKKCLELAEKISDKEKLTHSCYPNQ